jgi:hypothetical protein
MQARGTWGRSPARAFHSLSLALRPLHSKTDASTHTFNAITKLQSDNYTVLTTNLQLTGTHDYNTKFYGAIITVKLEDATRVKSFPSFNCCPRQLAAVSRHTYPVKYLRHPLRTTSTTINNQQMHIKRLKSRHTRRAIFREPKIQRHQHNNTGVTTKCSNANTTLHFSWQEGAGHSTHYMLCVHIDM